MKCQICKINKATLSAIINGVYYKNLCASCKPLTRVSSGHARWARDIDIQDNEAEIQQPYNADGTVNTRFAKLYPEQARAIFTEEQIRQANLRWPLVN